METKEDLYVLNPSRLRVFRGRNDKEVLLSLSGYVFPEVATSPDGSCIAWIPRSSALPSEVKGVLEIFWTSLTSRPNVVPFEGQFAELIAISSDPPRVIALCLIAKTGGQLIVVIDSITRTIIKSFGELSGTFGNAKVERLSFCNNGGRLAIGSRNKFVVVDIQSGQVFAKAAGRFPAMSPNGYTVAYVDKSSVLKLMLIGSNLNVSSSKIISGVYGIGAWSPNSQFVLAGVSSGLWPQLRLIALNMADHNVATLLNLSEGDVGSKFAWVSGHVIN